MTEIDDDRSIAVASRAGHITVVVDPPRRMHPHKLGQRPSIFCLFVLALRRRCRHPNVVCLRHTVGCVSNPNNGLRNSP